MKLNDFKTEIRDSYRLTKQQAAVRLLREETRAQEADNQIYEYLTVKNQYEGN